MKILISCLFTVLVSTQSFTQSIDVITNQINWHATRATNLDNPGDQFKFICDFVTHGNNSIKWIQKGAAGTTDFVVNSIEGEWKDTSKDGQIVFRVSQDETSGSITIKRKTGKTIISMDLGEGSRYKFEIGDYQKIN